ncbi:MAG: type I pantothenate kinase [Alphaproteobacteria bacterium]
MPGSATGLATYTRFARADWAALRFNTPLTLSEADLFALSGLNELVSEQEVTEVYLPLSRLLNLHVRAARQLGAVKDEFLGQVVRSPPYVIAIAGSVAVGKSTFARVLQAILARWPDHPHVELVTTDGFLRPNAWLQEHGVMQRKGFPESYDLRAMVEFLGRVKAGEPEAKAPVYSHQSYDIVPGQWQTVAQPDILIFEGLNVLQTGITGGAGARVPAVLVSDFFDFSLYLDAEESDIEAWYVQRFLLLQRTAFSRETSYFHHYKDLPDAEARRVARRIWREINRLNLRENILPTRERANLVLRKRRDHTIGEVRLRRI